MDPQELGFELAHIGINQNSAEEAQKTVKVLSALFGFSTRETEGAYFVNEQFEVIKKPFLGKHGHIGIRTNDALAARNYLESKGIVFNQNTATYDANGRLILIYFQEEIAGFAVHIVQKK